jgi:SEC-C motif-containing protein
MAKITPNDRCPCGLEQKFKKCCGPYLEGRLCENAERLLRVRYVAGIQSDAQYLWGTLHPLSPLKRQSNFKQFENELKLLKGLTYQSLKLVAVDDSKRDNTRIVHYVTVMEGVNDLSYVEETQFNYVEGHWYYMDGLRRSSARLGCVPESLRIGDLATLFMHDSEYN